MAITDLPSPKGSTVELSFTSNSLHGWVWRYQARRDLDLHGHGPQLASSKNSVHRAASGASCRSAVCED
jgi:hypothetical protein